MTDQLDLQSFFRQVEQAGRLKLQVQSAPSEDDGKPVGATNQPLHLPPKMTVFNLFIQ